MSRRISVSRGPTDGVRMAVVQPGVFGWLWRGALAGLAAAGTTEATRVLVGRNFRVLVPGRVYRCAQPSADDVRDLVTRYGVRTVVNLRGFCTEFPWYLAEARATADQDICHEDVTLSAGRLPSPPEVRRLVEVLDRTEYPIVLHCRRGVDRTGLTSAIVMLLYEGADVKKARRQLGALYGHVPFGRTAAMLRFFDIYERWLDRTCREHSADAFRDFVNRGYSPGPAKGRLEALDVPAITTHTTAAVKVRAHNDSDTDWNLRPGTGTGVHLRFQIFDAAGAQVQEGHAGLFTARVPPGGQIDLTLAIEKIARPGTYALHADLLDGPDTAFAQLGNEPLFLEFTVR